MQSGKVINIIERVFLMKIKNDKLDIKKEIKIKHKNDYIKCDNCRNKVEIIDEEIESLEGFSYIECPYCSQQIIINK
jgi:DNA-directed RNA polymerase subunit RPC12/RpoP